MTHATVKKLDRLFGLYVRSLFDQCQMCGRQDDTLQVSHRYVRANLSVRWDLRNVDLLCDGCHRKWERMTMFQRTGYVIGKIGRNEYVSLGERAITAKKHTQAEVNETIKKFKPKT